MRKTNLYQWYWVYKNSNGLHCVFETFEQAIHHAITHGEFDKVRGKEEWMAREEELIHAVMSVEELKDYSPIRFIGKEEK